jgi:hypothetical protein
LDEFVEEWNSDDLKSKWEKADTRFTRRASRESDGLNGPEPRVALSESGNPGLNDAIPSGLWGGGARVFLRSLLRVRESRRAPGRHPELLSGGFALRPFVASFLYYERALEMPVCENFTVGAVCSGRGLN